MRILVLTSDPQSTAILLLCVHGAIPRFDAAIAAAPPEPHSGTPGHRAHDLAAAAGMRIHPAPHGHRVAAANSARDVARAAETTVRGLLGHPIPPGVFAELAVGIGAEETHRTTPGDIDCVRTVFPLVTLGWSVADCRAYLAAHPPDPARCSPRHSDTPSPLIGEASATPPTHRRCACHLEPTLPWQRHPETRPRVAPDTRRAVLAALGTDRSPHWLHRCPVLGRWT